MLYPIPITGNFYLIFCCGYIVIELADHREVGYSNQSKYASWIGGSIIGSSSAYKDLKITRQEWEENGQNIIETKYY